MQTPCEPRNTKIHASIIIEATFGSDIQRNVAIRTLARVLEAWKANVESSHKNNKITISGT